MINGEAVRRKLEDRGNRIGKLLEQKANDEAILTELYLAALCREPTAGRTASHPVPREDAERGDRSKPGKTWPGP